MRTLGLVLIVIGIAATLFTGFTFISQKKIIDVGRLQINREEKTPLYWSPITGIIILGVGAVIYLSAKKGR